MRKDRWLLSVGIVLLAGGFWPHLAWCGLGVETLTLEHNARPGESYDGTVALANNSDHPMTVQLSQTDYSFSCDGSNFYGDPGRLPRSNAGWITVGPRQMEIPAHQSTRISYTVLVPADTTLLGTYWSIIMVEDVGLGDDSSFIVSRHQVGVKQQVRYGIQCITNIGEAPRQLLFSGTQLVAQDSGRYELQVDVENTGQLWMRPAAWVELYNQDGQHVGRFDSDKKRIFPGTSVRFRMNLGVIPKGPYKALVVLDNGDQNVYGAKYDLEF